MEATSAQAEVQLAQKDREIAILRGASAPAPAPSPADLGAAPKGRRRRRG